MISIFFIGFAIGMIFTYLIFQILYRVLLFQFKYKGKKHNLKIIKCKSCKTSFYAFDYETTIFCCNCILLKCEWHINI